MRETRSSGSMEGVMSNRDPYSDFRSRILRIILCALTSVRERRRSERLNAERKNLGAA